MKIKTWKNYGLWIAASEAVGIISGLISMDCIRSFSHTAAQPPLSPPGFIFPIVWTVLYALMGTGAAAVYLEAPSPVRSRGLNLFVVQLAMNFLWTPAFFCLKAYGFAFFWLLGLLSIVGIMTWQYAQLKPLAARLQIPYILWLLFAAYLNLGVWMLNG